MAVGAVLVRLNVLVLSVNGSFVEALTRFAPVISLCGQTYQTETAMWGDMFYSATIIIMYIYHALINALSAHMIRINLNMIFYTNVEHSPTKNNLHI